jgi:protein transport protein SEC20
MGDKHRLRRDTRATLLASKKAIDSKNARNAREELFHSSAVKEKQSLGEKVTYVVQFASRADA